MLLYLEELMLKQMTVITDTEKVTEFEREHILSKAKTNCR